MLALFRGETPIGCRSCSDVFERRGTVTNLWLLGEIAAFVDEAKALRDNALDPMLSEADHIDTLTRLNDLMLSARVGQLEVGTDGLKPGRVVNEYIVELRPFFERGISRPPRLLRLYYGEPVDLAASLLPMHLATKPNGPDVDEEQNDAIEEAHRRAEEWAFARATS